MTTTAAASSTRRFEWWMVSNLAVGAGFSAFVALLIPPYVTEITGSAAEAGVIMAVMSLAAVLGPIMGGFADRYRAHRLIMTLGIFGMAFAFAAFALAADNSTFFAIDAIIRHIVCTASTSSNALNAYNIAHAAGIQIILRQSIRCIVNPRFTDI